MKNNNVTIEDLNFTDSHVHFWDLEKLTYPWLMDIPSLNNTYDLKDFHSSSQGLNLQKIIFMQCECLPSSYKEEIHYIEKLAAIDNRISAIIPYFPLELHNAEEELEKLAQHPLIKGIRRLEESPTSLYLQPEFVSQMHLLAKYDLSFDICVKAWQLPAALELIKNANDQRFILDHFGKPDIKNGQFDTWKNWIKEIAQYPHVSCKLSGLLTETDFENWKIDELQPYVDYVIEHFGIERIMFASDWPVITQVATYKDWLSCAIDLCAALNNEEMNQVFHKNALTIYKIDN